MQVNSRPLVSHLAGRLPYVPLAYWLFLALSEVPDEISGQGVSYLVLVPLVSLVAAQLVRPNRFVWAFLSFCNAFYWALVAAAYGASDVLLSFLYASALTAILVTHWLFRKRSSD